MGTIYLRCMIGLKICCLCPKMALGKVKAVSQVLPPWKMATLICSHTACGSFEVTAVCMCMNVYMYSCTYTHMCTCTHNTYLYLYVCSLGLEADFLANKA